MLCGQDSCWLARTVGWVWATQSTPGTWYCSLLTKHLPPMHLLVSEGQTQESVQAEPGAQVFCRWCTARFIKFFDFLAVVHASRASAPLPAQSAERLLSNSQLQQLTLHTPMLTSHEGLSSGHTQEPVLPVHLRGALPVQIALQMPLSHFPGQAQLAPA